jgi:hypothetical protein
MLKDILAGPKNDEKLASTAGFLTNIGASKKANWDLERDLQPKLDQLKRLTDLAIIEHIREQVEKQEAEDSSSSDSEGSSSGSDSDEE